MVTVLAGTAAVVVAAMVALWLVSIALADVSIVDVWWGPGFAVVAWVAWLMRPAALAGALSPRTALVLTLVTLWAVRLATHLFLRWRGASGEDRVPVVLMGDFNCPSHLDRPDVAGTNHRERTVCSDVPAAVSGGCVNLAAHPTLGADGTDLDLRS